MVATPTKTPTRTRSGVSRASETSHGCATVTAATPTSTARAIVRRSRRSRPVFFSNPPRHTGLSGRLNPIPAVRQRATCRPRARHRVSRRTRCTVRRIAFPLPRENARQAGRHAAARAGPLLCRSCTEDSVIPAATRADRPAESVAPNVHQAAGPWWASRLPAPALPRSRSAKRQRPSIPVSRRRTLSSQSHSRGPGFDPHQLHRIIALFFAAGWRGNDWSRIVLHSRGGIDPSAQDPYHPPLMGIRHRARSDVATDRRGRRFVAQRRRHRVRRDPPARGQR
jgi:hypothetical protein